MFSNSSKQMRENSILKKNAKVLKYFVNIDNKTLKSWYTVLHIKCLSLVPFVMMHYFTLAQVNISNKHK